MLKRRKSALRAFTMIELMIVMIIVGILVASGVPIYRSAVSRAYEVEVVSSLGTLRTLQRIYYAQYARYSSGLDGLLVQPDDFRDMHYVRYDDFDIKDGNDDNIFRTVWDGRYRGGIQGYDYDVVTKDEGGEVMRYLPNEVPEEFDSQ